MTFYLASILTFYLASILTFFLASFLAFYLASILAFSLTYIYIAFCLAFFYLAFVSLGTSILVARFRTAASKNKQKQPCTRVVVEYQL